MAIRYDELIPRLKRLLPARRLAGLGRVVGFIERLRAIRAGAFVWAVVLSRFEPQRPGFTQARRWYKRLTGRSLWPRPFQMRFKDPNAVALFQRAFEEAVSPWRQGRRIAHPLARHFPDVVAWDSTWMQLSDCLRPVFKGTRGAKSSLKVCLGISVFGLLPVTAQITAGNLHDMEIFPPLSLFRRGTLFLFDKGFVAYARLRTIAQAGHHYLCPMRLNGNALITRVNRGPAWLRKAVGKNRDGVWLRDVLPQRKRIGRVFDLEVRLRPKARRADKRVVHTRLVIVPGPEREQRPYLTSLSAEHWAPTFLRETYRLRWQVELIFKELKQHLSLEVLPSKDQHAVQIFAWASLVALALSRTLSAWIWPLHRTVGLASAIRPQLVTRALRPTLRILGRALTAPLRTAMLLLRILADEILAEVRTLERLRPDTFSRLQPLLDRA